MMLQMITHTLTMQVFPLLTFPPEISFVVNVSRERTNQMEMKNSSVSICRFDDKRVRASMMWKGRNLRGLEEFACLVIGNFVLY